MNTLGGAAIACLLGVLLITFVPNTFWVLIGAVLFVGAIIWDVLRNMT